jgi:tRNA threonylcarbamoyladenosine biosynthesis protein TsaB
VIILAVDTATSILSVALGSGSLSAQAEGGKRGGHKQEVWYFEIDAGQRHGELLMEVTDRIITTAGLKPSAVELVVCMQGPGSFTGLRIGFAAAKGMALSLGIPMLTIPTLDCIAASCSFWPGLVIPVIDAKKQRYFTALYRNQEPRTGYLDVEPGRIAELIAEELSHGTASGDMLLTGPDAATVFPELRALFTNETDIRERIHLDPRRGRGWGKELLECAQNRLQLGNLDAAAAVLSGPLYIRKSDAELCRDTGIEKMESEDKNRWRDPPPATTGKEK